MDTLVIVGLVAIAVGLLVIFGAVTLLFVLPPGRSKAAPKVVVNPPPKPTPKAAKAEAAPDPQPAPPPPEELKALPPEPTEGEDDDLLNTGVLNARDFDNFEDLMAAADALTKPTRDGDR